MKRILMVGSSPNGKEWIDGNAIPDDVMVCPINNAWMLVKERMNRWYTAGDYVYYSPRFPSEQDFKDYFWRLGAMNGGIVINSFLKFPHWYPSPCNGTMVLNVLYDLINRNEAEKGEIEIYIVGCDMVYKEGETHFYGKGTNDPLRAGKEWLTRELGVLQCRLYDGTIGGVKVYNLSTQADTLLPFKRANL